MISAIRNQILDRILGIENTDSIKAAKEISDKNSVALQQSLDDFNVISRLPYPVEALGEYCGSYKHPSYGLIEIQLENDRLILSYGETKVTLYYKSENTFTGLWEGLLIYKIDPVIDLTFLRNASGDICMMKVPFEGFRAAAPITFIRS